MKNLRLILEVSILLVVIAALAIACGSGPPTPDAQKDKTEESERFLESGELPDIVNYIDRGNFTAWMEMSDDPTNILWCTFIPFGHEKITVPIVGKLTDSGKTPFPTKFLFDGADSTANLKVAEEADPFAMFGVSSEFRYGFDPVGNYVGFTDLPSFCSTEPRVFQATQSTIVIDTDPVLKGITDRAKIALAAGDNEAAVEILKEAEGSRGLNQ